MHPFSLASEPHFIVHSFCITPCHFQHLDYEPSNEPRFPGTISVNASYSGGCVVVALLKYSFFFLFVLMHSSVSTRSWLCLPSILYPGAWASSTGRFDLCAFFECIRLSIPVPEIILCFSSFFLLLFLYTLFLLAHPLTLFFTSYSYIGIFQG
ncbi:hypothetical protein BDA99DRAFT_212499 [Phascolomyces articulosus]|uniref:Uncharacterized protein n=1 Tax=Phascolomyces articulosus TaxID=60185 RepID=A0AAD5PAZ7_9FUNG|nr:hypothetical protein BDA99DRAFT_212499 [Phascolomyces articulosus]